MNDKKFDIVAIIVSIAAVLISFFAFTVESIVFAVTALVLSYRRKEKYRTKIPVFLSVLAIVLALVFFAFQCCVSITTGMPASDYWLIKLIF